MPQSIEQRRYWANRRKNEHRQKPKPKAPPVLLATSVEEYDELRREYPDMKVNLRLPDQQAQLFDTREYRDD